ncbi:hypothetical protein EDD21DRAFT_406708 [Dissophora ornata]|nr:hypothetical protein EDD21DRAFT_406708 [Dissophora ornata]
MAADRSSSQDSTGSGATSANNNPQSANNSSGTRPLFSLTVDPNALEQEIDQATHALHSTVNSLLSTMQSSVFGGLETLSKEMSTLEKNSKEFVEQHALENYQHHLPQFPWNFRTTGPKKRYRITIEELPPLEAEEDGEASSKVLSTTSFGAESSPTTMTVVKGKSEGDDFTIQQGKIGTADEGKTVITASVVPGLLDWLLFTTHDDSFFRRLGQPNADEDDENVERKYDVFGGTKVRELHHVGGHSKEEQEAAQKRIVPALVEKVKKVGTSWEKDARHWWQSKHGHGDQDNKSPQELDRQHHLFVGTSQSDQDQEEERHSQRWPRGRTWGRSESYSQTTVTRPDGTIEHRSVNSVNGETETLIKIQHPDGSIEETITRENHNGHSHNDRHGGFRDRWAHRRRLETDEDRERDALTAVVAEAMASEIEQQQPQQKGQKEEEGSEKSRSWPPKRSTRRQERDD